VNRAQVAALVEDERVHRDLYLSEALFALEQKHFFANTWNYVGHASQVPNAGDYVTLDLARACTASYSRARCARPSRRWRRL
jgi:hypothetical protein